MARWSIGWSTLQRSSTAKAVELCSKPSKKRTGDVISRVVRQVSNGCFSRNVLSLCMLSVLFAPQSHILVATFTL